MGTGKIPIGASAAGATRASGKRCWSGLIDVPDYEWLMIDASHSKAPPHAPGAPRSQSGDGARQRWLNTKIHLVMDVHGMPVRIIVTKAIRADCVKVANLMEGMCAKHLIADNGYDSDDIVAQAMTQEMQAQIPSRRNRKEQRDYDKHLYRQRHLVENAFLHIK